MISKTCLGFQTRNLNRDMIFVQFYFKEADEVIYLILFWKRPMNLFLEYCTFMCFSTLLWNSKKWFLKESLIFSINECKFIGWKKKIYFYVNAGTKWDCKKSNIAYTYKGQEFVVSQDLPCSKGTIYIKED